MTEGQSNLFAYGPMRIDLVDGQNPEDRAIRATYRDFGATAEAVIPESDPMAREIRTRIEQHPHSPGFVANLLYARLEQEGFWNDLSEPAISFAPSGKERKTPGIQETPARQPQAVEGPQTEVAQDAPGMSPVSDAKPEPAQQEKKADQERGKEKAAPAVESPVPDAPAPAPEAREPPEKQPEQALSGQEKPLPPLEQLFPAPEAPFPKTLFPSLQGKSPAHAGERNSKVFERKKQPDVLLRNPRNNKPYVLDYGDQVVVTRRALLGMGRRAEEKRAQAMQAALLAARERFGEPIRFDGETPFLQEAARQAVKLGIQLEPANKTAEHYYRKEMERAEREKSPQVSVGGGFSQSREKARSRGNGLELEG